jgi:hypothetical protein
MPKELSTVASGVVVSLAQTVRLRSIAMAWLPVLVVSVASWAQPKAEVGRSSALQVALLGRTGEVRRVGPDFAAEADGHLLTAAHLVTGEDGAEAVPLAAGAEHLE